MTLVLMLIPHASDLLAVTHFSKVSAQAFLVRNGKQRSQKD